MVGGNFLKNKKWIKKINKYNLFKKEEVKKV